MMNYANRALAAVYLLGWAVWAASIVGEPSSCQPATWSGALKFLASMACGIWLGWQACYEAQQAKKPAKQKVTGAHDA